MHLFLGQGGCPCACTRDNKSGIQCHLESFFLSSHLSTSWQETVLQGRQFGRCCALWCFLEILVTPGLGFCPDDPKPACICSTVSLIPLKSTNIRCKNTLLDEQQHRLQQPYDSFTWQNPNLSSNNTSCAHSHQAMWRNGREKGIESFKKLTGTLLLLFLNRTQMRAHAKRQALI